MESLVSKPNGKPYKTYQKPLRTQRAPRSTHAPPPTAPRRYRLCGAAHPPKRRPHTPQEWTPSCTTAPNAKRTAPNALNPRRDTRGLSTCKWRAPGPAHRPGTVQHALRAARQLPAHSQGAGRAAAAKRPRRGAEQENMGGQADRCTQSQRRARLETEVARGMNASDKRGTWARRTPCRRRPERKCLGSARAGRE